MRVATFNVNNINKRLSIVINSLLAGNGFPLISRHDGMSVIRASSYVDSRILKRLACEMNAQLSLTTGTRFDVPSMGEPVGEVGPFFSPPSPVPIAPLAPP